MAVLRNKTVLVTGASRGIGRTTASALAEAGAHVLVYYGRSVQDAESLVADIRSNEGRAGAIRADLGTPEGATTTSDASNANVRISQWRNARSQLWLAF